MFLCWPLWFASFALAQRPYDLLLQHGRVIDPATNTDRVMDIAIAGNKIARVASGIPAAEAKKVVDATGLYITPGLIDLHMHVYTHARQSTLFPDDVALIAGTTTVCDAGTSGWRTFEDFKASIIDKSATRVLAFLNIVGQGMRDGAAGESNEQDMDPVATAAKIKQYPSLIVGVKTAHYRHKGFTALKRAVEAGRLSGTPVLSDSSIQSIDGRTTEEKLLDVMRPGDIHTHMYNDEQLELVDRFSGKLTPAALAARKRGLLFDLGHGGGSFLWPVAARAMQQGFLPDTIGTDLHPGSIMLSRVSVPNCISKLMTLGMPLEDGIRRATVNPAKAIHRYPDLGTIEEGRTADIAVFELQTGVFAFIDSSHKKRLGARNLECVLTIRDGKVVYDRDGRSFPLWTSAGDYNVIR
ncbi:MAG TPA: amidohydrolase/deacetylase family metallohydrolase [Bryobacterales bacterium]|nr:amidohydrolase/deacetylase family metallohydrolase [Bryobacterales bacterium]